MPRIHTEWLKARKKELRLSDERIAAAIGRDRSIVNRLISGALPFDTKYVDGLAKALQLSREDVLYRFGVLEDPGRDIPEGAIPVTAIPHLGKVPGGNWREAIRTAHDFIPAPQPGMPPSAYALTVEGTSMDKIVRDGAQIVIDPTDLDLFDKWLYVVRNGDGEVTFKQYRESPARLVPCSTDPSHKVIPIADRDYEIVGRVILITMTPGQAALD